MQWHWIKFGGGVTVLTASMALAFVPLPESTVVENVPAVAPPVGAILTLAAGADLQAAVDRAEPGAVLGLAPGSYAGPLVIRKPLTLWGPSGAVIRNPGRSTTLQIKAPHVVCLGFTLIGSGHRMDTQDAAVVVHGDDVRIEGLTIRDALFGILVEKSARVTVRGNRIAGSTAPGLGLRGDTIRLWETTHSVVEDNRIEAGRDLVVWYSRHNIIRRNHVHNGRYGTHLMYSHDNGIENNTYIGNEVGTFVMYSRDVLFRNNWVANSPSSGGMGLGVKESGNLTATRNRFLRHAIGVFLDSSPQQAGEINRFACNEFRLCQTAIQFHGPRANNRFEGNSLRDNNEPVQVDGGGDATDALWHGNYFDDYAGFDLDGDGVGDVPFELHRLSSDLIGRCPDLKLFRGAPSLALLDATNRIAPLFAPKLILRDLAPRMDALSEQELGHAH